MIRNRLVFEIKQRIKNLGRAPICNCKPETAPTIGGKCFILCYRCTSIIVGGLGADIYNHFLRIGLDFRTAIIALFCVIPCFVDGLFHYSRFRYQSTNSKRIITGLIAGTGLLILEEYLINEVIIKM